MILIQKNTVGMLYLTKKKIVILSILFMTEFQKKKGTLTFTLPPLSIATFEVTL